MQISLAKLLNSLFFESTCELRMAIRKRPLRYRIEENTSNNKIVDNYVSRKSAGKW